MIIWEGPSEFNGKSIAVIATGYDSPSRNRKTGPMVQTYILHRDEHPREAIQSGADDSICGTCPARGLWCYASSGGAGQGLGSVWKKYRDGAYPRFTPDWLRRRPIRFGAYGDPAMAPISVWAHLADLASLWTGYTHQWRWCDPGFRNYLMASVDTLEEFYEAKRLGWRCYRVVADKTEKVKGESICPHYTTGLTCAQCGHCDGASRDVVKGHVLAVAHGSGAGHFQRFAEQKEAA